MAVDWARLEWTENTGSGDEKAVHEYVSSYLVKTTNPLDSEFTVLAFPGIPRLFSIYVASDGSVDALKANCRKLIAKRKPDDPRFWQVVCTFSSRTDQPALGNDDPLSRPSEVGWKKVSQSVVVTETVDGKAVVNSSGEKFDPPLEEDEVGAVFTCKKVYASDPNPALILSYGDAVNSDWFMGAPPGYAKLTQCDSQRRYEHQQYFFDVNFEVSFKNPSKPTGWQPRVLDQGFYTKDANGVLSLILDQYGQPVTAPVLLDGNGGLLNKASVALNVTYINGDGAVQLTSTPAWLANANFPVYVQVETEVMQIVGVTQEGNPNQFDVKGAQYGTGNHNHGRGVVLQLLPIYLTFNTKPALPFAALKIP